MTTLTTEARDDSITEVTTPFANFEPVATTIQNGHVAESRAMTLDRIARIATERDARMDWDLLARIGADDWEPKPAEA